MKWNNQNHERIWYHDLSVFRKRLKDLIIQEHITYNKLSERTGIAASTLVSYVYGSRMPYLDNLVILSEHFNVTAEYLLGLELEDEVTVENWKYLLKPLFPLLTESQILEIGSLITKYIKSNQKG